jgi:hypothetical protein
MSERTSKIFPALARHHHLVVRLPRYQLRALLAQALERFEARGYVCACGPSWEEDRERAGVFDGLGGALAEGYKKAVGQSFSPHTQAQVETRTWERRVRGVAE